MSFLRRLFRRRVQPNRVDRRTLLSKAGQDSATSFAQNFDAEKIGQGLGQRLMGVEYGDDRDDWHSDFRHAELKPLPAGASIEVRIRTPKGELHTIGGINVRVQPMPRGSGVSGGKEQH